MTIEEQQLQVEGMSVEEMLQLIFPDGVRVPAYDPRLDERFAHTPPTWPVPHRKKIEWLAARFERGEIGGVVHKAIYERRQVYSEAERLQEAACTRLLEIAEKKSPTPFGFQKYL